MNVIGTFSVNNGVLELVDNIEFNNTRLKFDLNSDYDGSKVYMEKILDHTSFDCFVFDNNLFEDDIDSDMLDTFLHWTVTKNNENLGFITGIIDMDR
jgi:hypothetical protein